MNTLSKTLFILTICTFGLIANNHISGKNINDLGEAISYSTILLYNVNDSSIVHLTNTDSNGHYTINDIANGNYYIAATMLSHISTFSKNISFPQQSNTVIDLVLQTYNVELPLIELVVKRPQKQLSMNENSTIITNEIATININLFDIMKKVIDEI